MITAIQMRCRSQRWGLLRGALRTAVAYFLIVSSVSASPDDSSTSTRLERGETLVYKQTLERGNHRYVGGVAYTVVETTPETIFRLMSDADSYRYLLPKIQGARKLRARGIDTLVEIRQGNVFFETLYTLRFRKADVGNTLFFWLDPYHAHGIEDAWGFLRCDPLPAGDSGAERLLLTYGILVDVGDGLARLLFEENIRSAMFTVPDRLRAYLSQGVYRTAETADVR